MGVEQVGQLRRADQDTLSPKAIGARAYRVAAMLRDKATGPFTEGPDTPHTVRDPRLRPQQTVLMHAGRLYSMSTTNVVPKEGELGPGEISVRLEEQTANGKPPIIIFVTSYFPGDGSSGEFYGGGVLVSGGDKPPLVNSTQAFSRIEQDFNLSGE